MSYDVLVTTPLFYSSGDPHIGHAYTLIIGDLVKKYYALIGKKAYLLTGVDEHGEKIRDKARASNLDTQEFVDQNSQKFQALLNSLEVSSDIFLRTTNENHKEFVLKLFDSLLKSQEIYLSNWSGYSCTSCETNYSEKYYSQNTQCELGHELKPRSENTYFLNIKKHAQWLVEHYKDTEIISPNHYWKNLKVSFLDELEDLSITRKNLEWGIKTPDSEFAIYVWFEALICYFSNPEVRKLWESSHKAKVVQIIGKEILRFHAIYLPIILKSQQLKFPNKLIVHGWLLNNNRKISKSESKTNPFPPLSKILESFSLESIKWYFVFLNWSDDHSFSEDLIKQFFNKYIVNLFGNLINRLKGIVAKNGNSTSSLSSSEIKNELLSSELKKGSWLIYRLNELIEEIQISEIIKEVIRLLESSNKLLEQFEPWKLSIDSDDYKELNVCLYRQLVLSAFLLSPIFDSKKWEKIKEALSIPNKLGNVINSEFLDSINNFEEIKLPPSSNLFEKYL